MSDTPLGEDEKTAALAWALRTDQGRARLDASPGKVVWPVSPQEKGARSLLDAVRLILEPFEGECRFCLFPVPHHAEDCPALPWVRAAARAGL